MSFQTSTLLQNGVEMLLHLINSVKLMYHIQFVYFSAKLSVTLAIPCIYHWIQIRSTKDNHESQSQRNSAHLETIYSQTRLHALALQSVQLSANREVEFYI